MKSKEELLIPRFEVLGTGTFHYPGSPFEVGKIIDLSKDTYVTGWEDFPHLFRTVTWWEYRKTEDMPKFVKFDYSKLNCSKLGFVFDKVYMWELQGDKGQYPRAFINEGLTEVCSIMNALTPATLEEYTEYQNSLTKKQ